MSKYNILLVDDEEENLSSTRDLLRRWGYNVDAVSSGEDAIESVRNGAKEYAAALLDYRMPSGKNGAETAQEIRALNDEIVLLMYSAYPSVEALTATIRAGGTNFIEKSEDINYLRSSVAKACEVFEQSRKVKPPFADDEVSRLIASIGMVGKSQRLAQVADKVQKFRQSNKPVLILGETGVGKEMVARALHNGGEDTFYVVNCAAFRNSHLVESELFGHEKGAFTGAATRKVGILEAARGGTVYLDELHYLDLATQGKLLRAIREKKIRRVGGLREEPVNFRLVASTWPDIEDRVADGTFTSDLYYRLKFLSIEIPALRERPEDVESLVAHFSERHFRETGGRKQFLMRTIRQLEQHSWPGNVGELDGLVTALLTECIGLTVNDNELETLLRSTTKSRESTFAQFEARQEREKRQFLDQAIKSSKSARHASQKLGMKPSSLQTLITRLGMREELDSADLEL
jgi:DNA-binding NtrC family response regulator